MLRPTQLPPDLGASNPGFVSQLSDPDAGHFTRFVSQICELGVCQNPIIVSQNSDLVSVIMCYLAMDDVVFMMACMSVHVHTPQEKYNSFSTVFPSKLRTYLPRMSIIILTEVWVIFSDLSVKKEPERCVKKHLWSSRK